MVSRRGLVLAAVLLAVLALGAAATAVQTIDGPESGSGGSDGEGADGVPNDLVPFITIPNWIVVSVFFILVLTALAGLVLFPEERRRFARNMALALAVALLVLLLADVAELTFLDGQPEPRNATAGTDGGEMPDGEQQQDGDDGDRQTSPLLPVLALLVAGIGGAVLVSWLLFGGDDGTDADVVGTDADRREALGRAAGRAADRIEEDSLENAVYQAWTEMTDALEVSNPGARTPAEFERAAVEAGLDDDDVETLTDLFREVRYGDAPVTTGRERRARETLRRLEGAYADGERATDGGATGRPDDGSDSRDTGASGGDATSRGRDADTGGGELP